MLFCKFTLILKGVSEPSEEIENRLFSAGCDDAVLFFREQIGYLEFERKGDDLQDVLLRAVRDIEGAVPEITVSRIEPADFVTAAEIARRTGRSRESVRLLMLGRRGEGQFPLPIAGVTSKTLIWSWSEVAGWFYENRKLKDPSVVRQAEIIKEINEALQLRGNPDACRRIRSLAERLGTHRAPAVNDRRS